MYYLYVLVGPPGSGKSTLAATLKAQVVCPDKIRKEITGDEADQSRNAEVFALAYQQTKDLLKAGKSVAFDATNVTKKARKAVLDCASKGCKKVAIYKTTDLQTCLKRNAARTRVVPEKVITRMSRTLEVPTMDEGFDYVFKNSFDYVFK